MKHTIEELRALCDAALDERWEVKGHGKIVSKRRKNNRGEDALVAMVYAHDSAEHRVFYDCEQDTTKFIAATDPPTVRALLDEIEKYRAALEKIANAETCKALHGVDKYKSHEDGWYGVIEFAQQALKGTGDE